MIDITDITITANGTNNIYALYNVNSSYSTARTEYGAVYSGEFFRCGQACVSVIQLYYVYRGTLLFDMSSISDNIKSAVLKFTGYADYSDVDFNIQLRGYTESTLTNDTTSYIAYGNTSFGSINSSSYSSSDDGMSITLNSSGISYLNEKRGGNCYFMLVSEDDMNVDDVEGSANIDICSGENSTATKIPHLELTYGTLWKPQIRFF